MDPVKIGILGYGWMGSMHAKMLKNIREAVLVAVADPLEKARKKALSENPGIKVYSDSNELLQDKEVDAVIIATPPNTHVPLLIKAVENHKHVLVEKPLAESLSALEPLLSLKISNDLVVMSGFSLRYHPMYIDLEKTLKELGETLFFHHTALGGLPPAPWITDAKVSGGLLNENAVHILYLYIWYFGFPDKVYASIRDLTTQGINDNVLYIAQHSNGTTASLLRSWSAKQVVRYFDALCSKGSIHIDGYLGGKATIVKNGEKITKEYSDAVEEMYTDELRDFIESIRTGRKPQVGLREGILVQILVHAAKESAKRQQVVEPLDVAGELARKLLNKY